MRSKTRRAGATTYIHIETHFATRRQTHDKGETAKCLVSNGVWPRQWRPTGSLQSIYGVTIATVPTFRSHFLRIFHDSQFNALAEKSRIRTYVLVRAQIGETVDAAVKHPIYIPASVREVSLAERAFFLPSVIDVREQKWYSKRSRLIFRLNKHVRFLSRSILSCLVLFAGRLISAIFPISMKRRTASIASPRAASPTTKLPSCLYLSESRWIVTPCRLIFARSQ